MDKELSIAEQIMDIDRITGFREAKMSDRALLSPSTAVLIKQTIDLLGELRAAKQEFKEAK